MDGDGSAVQALEAAHTKKGLNLAYNVDSAIPQILKQLETLEECRNDEAWISHHVNRLKSVDTLAAAHEVIYEIFTGIISKLGPASKPALKSFLTGSSTTGEQNSSRGSDEDYAKLEKELQKYEAKVRMHIRVVPHHEHRMTSI